MEAIVPQAEIKYFSVTPKKLVLMSITTFSLYDIYWFYKNWKAIKEFDKSKISPFWRAVFSIFYCYSLFGSISRTATTHEYSKPFSPGLLASLYIIFTLMGSLSGKDPIYSNYALSTILFVTSFLSVFPLLITQKAINFNYTRLDVGHKPLDTFSGWEILFAVVGGALIILALIPY